MALTYTTHFTDFEIIISTKERLYESNLLNCLLHLVTLTYIQSSSDIVIISLDIVGFSSNKICFCFETKFGLCGINLCRCDTSFGSTLVIMLTPNHNNNVCFGWCELSLSNISIIIRFMKNHTSSRITCNI